MISQANTLPTDEGFRQWVTASLAILKTTPTTLSRDAGLSINTVSRFLAGGGITLKSAARLECRIRTIADDSVSLPDLKGVRNGLA